MRGTTSRRRLQLRSHDDGSNRETEELPLNVDDGFVYPRYEIELRRL